MSPAELSDFRKQHGMTQADLAALLRMSPNNGDRTVRRWENGDSPVPFAVEVALWALFEAADLPERFRAR
jgi:transcriptional regulator with XRE-family HTH domain